MKEISLENHKENIKLRHIIESEHFRTVYFKVGEADGQAKERLRIGRVMLEKGLDISIISDCTKLSQDKILAITNLNEK
ncbi:MAG: hypothetical protein LBE31_10900 [Deltaproteobacteria bacterium]|nr:hypothetical protein [Deltaproteobacteria bacterium]